MGNKAVAGSGTVLLASQLVLVVLWLLHQTPPQEVLLAIEGIVGAVLSYASVYFMPHNEPAPPPTPPVPSP